MKWEIHQKADPHRGVNVVTVLYEFERDDHDIIHQHNMVNVPICRHEDRPPELFGRFYRPAAEYISIIPMEDAKRANWLREQIDRGLTSFVKLMNDNRVQYKPYPKPPEPFVFYENHRFRHQWVIGDSGSGKTTFLANLIAHDLEKVARDEASIVILDSQVEDLTSFLPHSARFAPGGDLAGRLVYLEYDPAHPLAFNIFANPDAGELCDFVMKSIVGAEITTKQNVFYDYLLTAATIVPKANIYTVQEMLMPGGRKIFSDHLTKLRDPRVRDWLRTRWDDDIFKETKEQILYRLNAFTSPRNVLANMLASTEDKFDLGKEIQQGKVIIINTNRKNLKRNGTRTLGRFFIYQVLQAMEDRMDIDRHKRIPTYFYIDEATDYIEDDDNIPDLLEKARKQKIGLIIAHQKTGEGSRISKNVQSALSGIYIQSRLFQPGKATVMLKDDPTHPTVKEIEVKPVDLGHPRMSDTHWNAIVTRMREDYSYDLGGRLAHAVDDLPPDTFDE